MQLGLQLQAEAKSTLLNVDCRQWAIGPFGQQNYYIVLYLRILSLTISNASEMHGAYEVVI